MVGVHYLKWFPEMKFKLNNGLTIYESQFTNVDGSKGVICGPHKQFAAVLKFLTVVQITQWTNNL